MAVTIKKAERKQAKLRLAWTGPSGSGKTMSALLVASALGKRILVLDTENHSASLYVGEPGVPDFDVIEIDPPYTVEKYIEAIKAGMEGGYEVVIIDSITHAWAGEGGLLAQKEALDGRGGNSYTNWGAITKKHEEFKSWLLKVDVHLMVTMRSKQDYVLETNDKGKQQPRKVGLAPIQREGMEYEFTMVLDLGMNHFASISKTRVRAFDGRLFVPDRKTGEELLAWLNEGSARITKAQSDELIAAGKEKGLTAVAVLEMAGVTRMGEISVTQLTELKAKIAAMPDLNQAKMYDTELEAYLRAGVTLAELESYASTLPFAGDLGAVAGKLKTLRESSKTPEDLRKAILVHAGAPK